MGFFKSAVLALGAAQLAQAYVLNVASTGGNSSSPLQYGVMFEDINHSGEGGIYAELIQNRAFQLPDPSRPQIAPWTAVGGAALAIDSSLPLSALPNSVKVTPSSSSGWVGISNPGWWGIEVKSQKYTGEFYVHGTYNGNIQLSLSSTTTGQTLSSKKVHVSSTSSGWTHVKFSIHPPHKASDVNNAFSLAFDSSKAKDGSLNFNFISLFPPTYKNRPNGMRVDLMESLAELSPSFNRIPGGNNLEGQGPEDTLPRFKWNESIGPLIDRPGRQGTWGYFNTEGLGLAEYLNWCVDLDMTPILAVWDGHWLNGTVVSEADLQPYVDDVMNELEYIMGSPTDTVYGRLRAQQGNPEGWNIQYVEIGNEDNLSNGEPTYVNYRFDAFCNAIIAKYPTIQCVASALDIVPLGQAGDFHTYSRPDNFVLSQFNFFDQYTNDRQYMVGEYATVQFNEPPFGSNTNWSAPLNMYPFWQGGIAEAVFLIGLERNTDKMIGASYAPTLANNNSIQWHTDMIYFTADTSATVRSTSHHVVSLLSGTRHTEVLPVTSDTDIGPLYYVAGVNTDTGSYMAKFATYNATEDVPVTLTFEGLAVGTRANLTWIEAPDAFSHAWEGYDPVTTHHSIITAKAGANGAATYTFSLPNYVVAVLSTKATYGGYGVGAESAFAGFGGYAGCKNGKGLAVPQSRGGSVDAKAAGRGNGC